MQSGDRIPSSSRNFSLFSSGIQLTAWGPPCYWAIYFARSLLIWMLISSKKIASQHHLDWCLNEQLPHSLFSSFQSLSHVWLFVTPWTAACQDSLSITNSWSLLNSCPSSQWYHPTISSSVIPFSPVFNLFQHQGLFKWISSSHQVAKVLEYQLQRQPFQWISRTDLL